MASPTVQTASENSGNSATPTITEPASATSGDLLVAVIGSANAATAISGLTGWTQLGEGDDTQGNRYWYGWIIRGASAPDLTAAAANARWVAMCLRIDGHDATTPIGTDHGTANGSGTTPDPPNVDPGSSRDHLAVAAFIQEGKGDNRSTDTTPSGYTEHADIGTTGSGAGTIHVGGAMNSLQYTGQAQNPGAYTSATNDGWIAITVLVRPSDTGQNITGSAAFTPTLSFPAGSVDLTVIGAVFAPTLSFPAGHVHAPAVQIVTVSHTGQLTARTRRRGTVLVEATAADNSQTVTGAAAFTPTLAFPQGSVDLTVIGGAAFTPTLSFPAGSVDLVVTGGAAFTPTLAFPTGQIDLTILGAVFAPTLSFPTGTAINRQLVTGSAAFTPTLSFPQGSISTDGGLQTLVGTAAFTPGLTFPQGSVDLTVLGSVFAPTLSFPTGSVDLTVIGAAAFAPTLAFPTGSVDLVLVGATFTPTLSFPTGQLDLTILGAVFAPTLSFPTGTAINRQLVIGAAVFAPTLVFATGILITAESGTRQEGGLASTLQGGGLASNRQGGGISQTGENS
jgi:hypothetical protein